MKKILILCSLLCTSFLWSQGTIQMTGSKTAEVGNVYTYTATFIPSNAQANVYNIQSVNIVASTNGSTILGGIQGLNGNSSYQFNYPSLPPGNSSTLNDYVGFSTYKVVTFTVKWGNNAPDTDKIYVQFQGIYGKIDSSNGSFAFGLNFGISYKDSNGDNGYEVDVKKIQAPSISNPTLLACSNNNIEICASNFGDANSFAWNISGGSIVNGQGSTCITVTPSGNNNVTASCTVKRSSGLSNYTASNTRTITRTARTIDYSTATVQSYICKSSGLVFQVTNETTLNSVAWNAPNCSVSAETIDSGMRKVTITPNSSFPIGTLVSINATASYAGGCTATTPTKSYGVFDSSAATPPQGEIYVDQGIGPDDWNIIYASSSLDNGFVSVSPSILTTQFGPVRRNIKICTINPCNGTSSCRFETVYVSSSDPDYDPFGRSARAAVSPNPTSGSIQFALPERGSGNYQIFEQNTTTLLQEGKFKKTKELQIDLLNKIKSGVYILKVITENNTFTERIILNK